MRLKNSLRDGDSVVTCPRNGSVKVATREAYEEGGYEVDQAHFFYNSFRAKPGGLEMLADRATTLLKDFQ